MIDLLNQILKEKIPVNSGIILYYFSYTVTGKFMLATTPPRDILELRRRKVDLRNAARHILGQMDRSEAILRSQIMSKILYASSFWQSANSILLFAPIASEPDLIPVDFQGKEIYCLKSLNSQYEPVRLFSREDLKLGPRGIREPLGEAPFLLEKINLIVVPGLAFDRKGIRLGRGGGHYDRILERYDCVGKVIGACFACQIISEVPREEHDSPVSALLTENGLDCIDHVV